MAESANYPVSITTQLYEAVARKSTTLTADIDSANTTLTVASTSGFPSKGFVSVGNETIYYGSTTSTTLAGCTRGYAGTAVSHNEDDEVKLVVAAATTNRIRLEIAAIQNYIGASGTTYANSLGYIIGRSNYLGASTEGQLNVGYLGGSTEGQLNVGYLGGSTNAQLNPEQVDSIRGTTLGENAIYFSPDAFNVDNDNPASEVTIDGTSITPRLKKLEFGNTDESDLTPFRMPRSYDGETITVDYLFCSSTASSVHTLGLAVAKAGDGDAYNPTLGDAHYFDIQTASATTGNQTLVSKDFAGVTLGLTYGDKNYVRVLGGTTCACQVQGMKFRWNKG